MISEDVLHKYYHFCHPVGKTRLEINFLNPGSCYKSRLKVNSRYSELSNGKRPVDTCSFVELQLWASSLLVLESLSFSLWLKRITR